MINLRRHKVVDGNYVIVYNKYIKDNLKKVPVFRLII